MESLSHVIWAALGAISQETAVSHQATQVEHLLTADDLVKGEDDLAVLAHEIDHAKRLGYGHSAEVALSSLHVVSHEKPGEDEVRVWEQAEHEEIPKGEAGRVEVGSGRRSTTRAACSPVGHRDPGWNTSFPTIALSGPAQPNPGTGKELRAEVACRCCHGNEPQPVTEVGSAITHTPDTPYAPTADSRSP